jgi:oligopeptide/dipeptide ABC transporter ATP-binding protein
MSGEVELEPIVTSNPVEDDVVLRVEDLTVTFPTRDGPVPAVNGVSFSVAEGQTLGIVGESGSGKTVTSMSILGLLPKRAQISGKVSFRGTDLLSATEGQLREVRGNRIAMVFQDALTSLNPVMRVGTQIAEMITTHHDTSKSDVRQRVVELLDLVGVPNPSDRADQYPHEFSGGMRQRAMIAMAIANEPDLLIADEPTTALDVTIQAQVMDVFERIQDRTRSAMLLITHDLGVVAGVADEVMVMYAGRDVEHGTVDELFYDPRHPYTRGLLSSLPRPDVGGRSQRLQRIRGNPPSLLHLPPGCSFWPRCVHAQKGKCDVDDPDLFTLGGERSSRCFFAEQLPLWEPIDG